MRPRHPLPSAAAMALLTLLACEREPACPVCTSPDSPVDESEPPVESDPPAETDPPAEDLRDAACATAFYVGYSADAPCEALLGPDPAGWATWRLFFQDSDAAPPDFTLFEVLPQQRAQALWGWCVAERRSPTAAPADPGLLHPDCDVVAALATTDEVAREVQPGLRAAMLEQLSLPASLPPPVTRARVVVIDTAVTSSTSPFNPPDQARHGCAMGALVQEVSCLGADPTDPSCRAAVRSQLALHLVPGDPPTVNLTEGGFYGPQRVLAREIVRAVERWAVDGRPGPLVLNLSVGWHGRYNEPASAPGTLRRSVEAVLTAIEAAACEGALVIAAAGNQGGGTDDGSGPMYPAAWESRPLPAGCASAGAGYAPILYAVGAVAYDDQPTLNTRPAGTPRLVAPGWHAAPDVARYAPACADGGAPVTMLTGSSVAAALTSGAAAALHAAAPSLTAAEVMELLYDPAVPLSPSPDGLARRAAFGLSTAPGAPVRRLSVCAAAQALCDRDPATAGCPVSCTSAPPYRDTAPTAATPAPPAPSFAAAGLPLQSAAQACPGGCPHDRYTNGFVAPQAVLPHPGTDPCTECWIELTGSTGTLQLAINPRFGSLLRHAKLSWFDRGGARLGVVNLARATGATGTLGDGLAAGEVLAISDVTAPLGGARARLEWVMIEGEDRRSATSELRVVPELAPSR